MEVVVVLVVVLVLTILAEIFQVTFVANAQVQRRADLARTGKHERY